MGCFREGRSQDLFRGTRHKTRQTTHECWCAGRVGRGESVISLSLLPCHLPPSVIFRFASLFSGPLRFSDRDYLPIFPLSYFCFSLFPSPLCWSLHSLSPPPALSVPSAPPLLLSCPIPDLPLPLLSVSLFSSAVLLIVPPSPASSVSTGC